MVVIDERHRDVHLDGVYIMVNLGRDISALEYYLLAINLRNLFMGLWDHELLF